MSKSNKVKFAFDSGFQLEILRFILQDKEGGLVLKRIKSSYLTLIEHSIIAEGIARFFKKSGKIPSKNVLREVIKELLESKDYADLVTKDDIPNINKLIDNLYSIPIKDRDYIQEKVYKFTTFVEMKNLNDSFDLNDFGQYEEYYRKIDKILQKAKPKKEDEPLFLIRDVVDRQFKRQADPAIIPSPYRQMNKLTNAGGFPAHSVGVLLDKPKARKTFFLVNLALGYLRMKKSVLYIDTENGKDQIMDRVIQASIGKTKKEVYSGEYDNLEAKHIRKLQRFGVEMVIERVPAMVTDCNYISDLIHKLEQRGIHIKVVMIDYAAKLASIQRDREDFDRISNVFVDIQNMAEQDGLDMVWTANHITREGKKHRATKYDENDIAKCVDIVRHVQVIYGLNATEQEDQEGIQRLELVVQRDGLPSGRCLFKVDIEKQKAKEFTVEERKSYDKLYGEKLDQAISKGYSKNPDADPEKRKHTTGDI